MPAIFRVLILAEFWDLPDIPPDKALSMPNDLADAIKIATSSYFGKIDVEVVVDLKCPVNSQREFIPRLHMEIMIDTIESNQRRRLDLYREIKEAIQGLWDINLKVSGVIRAGDYVC